MSKLQALDIGIAEHFCLAFELDRSGQVISVTKNWPLYFPAGNHWWQEMFPEIDVSKPIDSKLHRDCLSRCSVRPIMFRCTVYDLGGRSIFVARAFEQYSKASLELMSLASIAQQSSGVPHDLSNLVTILLGYQRQIQTALQQDPPPLERVARASTKIFDVSHRMVGLATGMKALSHKKNLVPPEAIDMNEILKEVLERCEHKFNNHNVKAEFVSEVKSGQVVGASGRLSLMLMSLVGWCIKAIQNGPDPYFKGVLSETVDQITWQIIAGAHKDQDPAQQEWQKDLDGFDLSWEFSFCYFMMGEHLGTISWHKSSENMQIVLSFPKSKQATGLGGGI